MNKTYTIFAALSDETNEGWVWFRSPSLPTRTIVKIYCRATNRTVFCESRKIDPNFVKQHNDRPHTAKIASTCEPLVISEWYRNALGGFATKSGVELEITQPRIPVWRDLRVSCHHPQIAVRLATRLGVLGTWLGNVGLTAALLDLKSCLGGLLLIAVAVIGAAIGFIACRGPNPPNP